MTIWIDFINTPQVAFFIPFIRDQEYSKHKFLLTCRDSGNTIELLKSHNLPFYVLGEKIGNGKIKMFYLFFQRLFKLYFFIRKNKPDIAVGQSSFYQPVIAKIFNIPCLYTNDNEHASGNIFGFLFATKVILPIALKNEVLTAGWALKGKVSFYPSVKEAIYLSQQSDLVKTSLAKSVIYFRPEPSSAEYYKGNLNFFDDTLLKLSQEYHVVVLPRDKIQKSHYRKDKFITLTVAEAPLDFYQIVSNCLLFIGAGGSMTRELAVMGVKVLSVYQDQELRVDKYLVEKGQLRINPEITYEEILTIIDSPLETGVESSTLNEGKESYLQIKNLLATLEGKAVTPHTNVS